MKDRICELIVNAGIHERDVLESIKAPTSQNFGDYAFSCFSVARKKGVNPKELAKQIASRIMPDESVEMVVVAGPYVNFFVNPRYLALDVFTKIGRTDKEYGSGNLESLVVLEFPSPNTNKPLHIGHARNIILGQAVSNIMSFMGNKVVKVNLNNDRGIHICKSMVAYELFGQGQTPENTGKKSDHLVGEFYVKFHEELNKDPSLEERAKESLRKWESGDEETRRLWIKMNEWAIRGFEETYKKFCLRFDKEYFESEIYSSAKELVLDALNRGTLKKSSDGAVIIELGVDKKQRVLLRNDGTSVYMTQDLYLAKTKKEEFNFDRSICITAHEQKEHFKSLFEILRILGYSWVDRLEHLSYGMVNLESGRLKSREGNVIDIDDFLESITDLASKEVEKRSEGLSSDKVRERASIIAKSSVRYYFLRGDRNSDITFKPQEALDFNGETGTYLLYSYARARSILKKVGTPVDASTTQSTGISKSEKNLLMTLSQFPEAVRSAYDKTQPHILANYAYSLARGFNEFYHAEKVIDSENMNFRAALTENFSRVLKRSLSLLEIDVLNEM